MFTTEQISDMAFLCIFTEGCREFSLVWGMPLRASKLDPLRDTCPQAQPCTLFYFVNRGLQCRTPQHQCIFDEFREQRLDMSSRFVGR